MDGCRSWVRHWVQVGREPCWARIPALGKKMGNRLGSLHERKHAGKSPVCCDDRKLWTGWTFCLPSLPFSIMEGVGVGGGRVSICGTKTRCCQATQGCIKDLMPKSISPQILCSVQCWLPSHSPNPTNNTLTLYVSCSEPTEGAPTARSGTPSLLKSNTAKAEPNRPEG